MRTYLKERKRYQTWKNGYYHLSSDGWQDGKLFHNDAQYAYGMLLMGLLTLRFKIVIYDFTLMDNHVHILMSGTGNECCRAFDYFKMKMSSRLVKDGFLPLPHNYGFKLTPVINEEQMRINFLYIDRNALERGLCVPGGYPWGCAYLHCGQVGHYLHGVPAASLSKHRLELMAGTRTPIPPGWEFHPQLGLLPAGFVNNRLFERLFPNPKDYQTRLVKDYEAFVKIGRSLNESLSFSQKEERDIAEQLARTLFPGKTIACLSHEEKGRLCVQLESRFGFTPSRIAETVSITEHLVKQFLSSKDYGKR